MTPQLPHGYRALTAEEKAKGWNPEIEYQTASGRWQPLPKMSLFCVALRYRIPIKPGDWIPCPASEATMAVVGCEKCGETAFESVGDGEFKTEKLLILSNWVLELLGATFWRQAGEGDCLRGNDTISTP